MKPVVKNYRFTSECPIKANDSIEENVTKPERLKPVITVHLEKPNCLVEMENIPGFTFKVGEGYKISFSIDLNSTNFIQANVFFRRAVQRCQTELSLQTRDVHEILQKYEAQLRAHDLLVEVKTSCEHKDYSRLGHYRPDGNAF